MDPAVLPESLISKLKKYAAMKLISDTEAYWDVMDMCGGNMDDAYSGGVDHGYTHLAREILDELGISWK